MRSLVDRRFRGNPKFELVLVSELPPDHQVRLQKIAGDKVFAVLRCRQTHDYVIALDLQTALLVQSLTTTQSLSGAPGKRATRRDQREVARLVCDQVIQLELPNGSFVDGIAAYEHLFDHSDNVRMAGGLDAVSKAAIDYAFAMPPISSVALARRLYLFNSSPRTHTCDGVPGRAESIAPWLGLDSNTTWRNRLNTRYQEHGSRTGTSPWLQWIRHDVDVNGSMRHKLYVSPIPKQLPDVFRLVADVCVRMDVPAFKVGITIPGVLRSDKLVVYADDEVSLAQIAAELRFALQGLDAQGVPFTTPLDGAGLMSWAIDPDMNGRLWFFSEPWSWRMAVAACLGESISRAKGHGRDELVIDFALQRLRLDLIEPVGWRSMTEGDE